MVMRTSAVATGGLVQIDTSATSKSAVVWTSDEFDSAVDLCRPAGGRPAWAVGSCGPSRSKSASHSMRNLAALWTTARGASLVQFGIKSLL